MFDIAFSELVVIGVIALVVIGPEKLPRVARTMGHLLGRLQRYVTQVKSDINREMDLSELKGAKTEFENAARSFQQDVESKAADTEREIRDAQAQIDREMQPQPQDASTELVREPAATAEPSSPQLELGIEDTYPAGQASRKVAG